MSETVEIGTRTRQALLVNLRQKLLASADALVSYSELLREQAEELNLHEMFADLDQILSAARELFQQADKLSDKRVTARLFENADLEQTERQLRHDLRTPINAIKGYGEMLLEDLDEFCAHDLRPDFEKLLSETNRLLSDLDSLVKFPRSGLESKQWSEEERQQRRFIRQAFSRLLSSSVVDQLVSDPSKLSLGGERLDITCVFTDLAGFTSLVETHEPTVVLPVLNRYLEGLRRVFLEHNGTIDKIVGDALNGFFGAPLKQPDHALRAIRCALALEHYALSFQTQTDATALDFGVTRIGVHSGCAVVGNFGGDSFFDYTARGDVINATAGMERANQHLGTTICVSGSTASQCPDIAFRPIGHLLLNGQSQSIEAFEPLSEVNAQSPEISDYLDAYRLMEKGDANALLAFTDLANRYPDDSLAVLHVHRLAQGQTGTLIVLGEK